MTNPNGGSCESCDLASLFFVEIKHFNRSVFLLLVGLIDDHQAYWLGHPSFTHLCCNGRQRADLHWGDGTVILAECSSNGAKLDPTLLASLDKLLDQEVAAAIQCNSVTLLDNVLDDCGEDL